MLAIAGSQLQAARVAGRAKNSRKQQIYPATETAEGVAGRIKNNRKPQALQLQQEHRSYIATAKITPTADIPMVIATAEKLYQQQNRQQQR